MTNQISHFYFEQQSSIRIHLINEEPWFVAVDICAVLGIVNSRDALSKLDEDERGVALTDTLSGRQKMAIINESGLYTLILRCRDAVKPGTVPHRFRKWVTNEVLPAIRKTGRYQHPAATRRRTAEPLTSADMQNLNWLVQNMVSALRYQGVWTQAIWYSLRQATGRPSPEPFCVEDLPALTQECRRIITVTGLVNEKVAKFEREAARRILRKREDCQMVISNLQREFDSNGLSGDNIRRLERYEQIALARLGNRAIL
ncbi:TPA: hypothetical protein LT059_005212 [Salmonella enterica subsp. enterica serovar Kodjovi]|nr:hypothetical protein [Salmonella enterica subsp. enterica serovar Kodjovi]